MARIVAVTIGLAAIATAATAADLPVKTTASGWDWSGLYVGVHTGAAMPGITRFSDPFGSPIYGDRVRTPGWLFGGQIGHNWQAANSPWVFGVEADISGLDSDGTRTCFAVSGDALNTTCRVRPDVMATLTGRLGYAIGPQGRTLLYLKGGFAWARGRIDMATNNAADPPFDETTPPVTSNRSHYSVWGGTIGAGVEYAVTPAWSFKLEYGYVAFARTDVANLGSVTVDETGTVVSESAPGSAGIRQDLHLFKVGLNYKWGADPWAAWPTAPVASSMPVKAPIYKAAPAGWAPAWEYEIGGRYVGHWSRFQDDLGQDKSNGAPPISAISRLTYNATDSDSGEIFGRIDTPWNWFVKGFIGRGKIHDGHMNDEDFGITGNDLFVPYSNTIHSKVVGKIKYGTVDVGYNFWRGQAHKVGAFVGYNYYEQNMAAHGCAQIANPNSVCIPPEPVSAPAGLTQDTKWKSLRVGVGGEFIPYERIKLSGEVAYLPYVKFNGLDRHFFLGSGALASVNPDRGHGRGVQLEGLISYLITPNFSVGVGGRYWAMWTNASSDATRTIECSGPGACAIVNTPPQFMKGAVEQASVFVQGSFKFDSTQAVAARY